MKDRARILCLQSPKTQGDHGDVPHFDEQAEGFYPSKHMSKNGDAYYSNYAEEEESKFCPLQESLDKSFESDASGQTYKNCNLHNLEQTVYNGVSNLHQNGANCNEYFDGFSTFKRTNLNSDNCNGKLMWNNGEAVQDEVLVSFS